MGHLRRLHHHILVHPTIDGGRENLADNHMLSWVSVSCHTCILLSAAQYGAPFTNFPFRGYSRSLLPTKANPETVG